MQKNVPRVRPHSLDYIDPGFVEIGLVQLSQSEKTTDVTHTHTPTDRLVKLWRPVRTPVRRGFFALKTRNGLRRFAPSALPYYKEATCLNGKNGLITSREEHEAKLPRTCSRPCEFEGKKKKNTHTKSHQTRKKHTTKHIHRSPATAITSRRRAVKHVPLGSPYSLCSSIDPEFLEIGLACMHAYVYTRTSAAVAAPHVYVLVLYTIFWPAQLRLSLL